ncbi:Lrp/AsnC ligand binding domain-containing protein [Streptomyces sp. NBC_01136]|uniref:Lrp/AsnC family transcriptional regulator n=1 Tax=unclassified Streptomyces TaxID=2593676 RepID=UPI00324B80E1|nr:Lrp/AsnC ligand binding domain-containing protein [Streptomyces sp. NBC_01136]
MSLLRHAATNVARNQHAHLPVGHNVRPNTSDLDVDMNDSLLGATAQALLWMSVAPAYLDEVARTLAGHAELAFVAATTGPTNLVAQALCPDPAALHTYLTRRLGALEAIRTLETAPVLRTLKAAGPVIRNSGGRR